MLTVIRKNRLYRRIKVARFRHTLSSPTRKINLPTTKVTKIIYKNRSSHRYRRPRTTHFINLKCIGLIEDDTLYADAKPLTRSKWFTSYVSRYDDLNPWNTTDIYKDALIRFNKGGQINGCRTCDAFTKYLHRLDKLHDDIRRNGYKTQHDLGGYDITNEIEIGLDKNGDLVLINGIHRYLSARMLGLEFVPAVINIVNASVYRDAQQWFNKHVPLQPSELIFYIMFRQ